MDIPIQKTTSQTSVASTQSSIDSLDAVRKRVVSDFEFGETLGEGSYSTVLLAKDRLKDRLYAVKVLEKRHIIKENKVKYVTIEKDVLNTLKSKFVVRLYYTFQDQSSLYFVLEYCPNGDLLALVKKHGRFEADAAKFYGFEIALGLQHIHSRNILHRDLKPENILLDQNMHLKITDFGSAKILDGDNGDKDKKVDAESLKPGVGRKGSFVGTAEYCSPELLNERAASFASDTWALGCILYQMLVGVPPLQGGNEYQTFQKIIRLDYSIPSEVDKVASDLISSILRLEPAERPSLDSVLGNEFFSSLLPTTIRTLKAPVLADLQPLRPPNPTTDNLYMDPAAYFSAKNRCIGPLSQRDVTGTVSVTAADSSLDDLNDLEKAAISSDSWLPDLSNTDVVPESILMSAVVKKKTDLVTRTRGLLLNRHYLYIYEIKTRRVALTIPLDRMIVERVDANQFLVKPIDTKLQDGIDRFTIDFEVRAT